jgi:hypothetical protein
LRIIFSICHTTARPAEWRTAYDAWISAAKYPEHVEYVLVCDQRWGFTELPKLRRQDKTAWNTDRMCLVGGANVACAQSTGKVLIISADDMFPPEHWDEKLLEIIPELDSDFVIRTASGTPADDRGLIVLQILSRARYKKLGYGLHPAYDSMYADDDFTQHGEHDGVVIEARHLLFEHRHPVYNKAVKWDDVYRHENKEQAYAKGHAILEQRRLSNFESNVPVLRAPRKTIVVCLPGLQFAQAYVKNWTELFGYLASNFNCIPLFAYSTNVYACRAQLAACITEQIEPKPDYVLTFDDDNILSVATFRELMKHLDGDPELDGAAAWCWVLSASTSGDIGTTSAGELLPSGLTHLYRHEELMEGPDDLKPFTSGGLPGMLFRYSAFEKAGQNAFAPLVGPQFPHGFSGEDVAFFTRAHEGGAKFAVDRRLKIPHMRNGIPEPQFIVDQQHAARAAQTGPMSEINQEQNV